MSKPDEPKGLLERAIYVDRDTGKVMLDVTRFCAAVVWSYRPTPPEGFYGHGIGELLDEEKP